VVTADQGKIYFSTDQSKLIMDLTNGEIHESDVKNTGMYRKVLFENHRIAMNADQFSFQQTATGIRGERELTTGAMQGIVDSIKIRKINYDEALNKEVNKYLFIDSVPRPPSPTASTQRMKRFVYIQSNYRRVEWSEREIEKYDVEIYKKYALPVACIVFILIGAPLGVMVKRGGFGVAASISLFFFLLYWAFLIGGEKLSERDIISPFIGMWAANILLTILGIILTVKTNKETVTIQFTFLKKLVPRRLRINYEIKLDENPR
jgi:lipopolysaccharide export system permease protein